MKLKLPGMLFALIMLTGILQSQTLSPTVISSSGAFYSNSSGMLSTTVGEMTMVETFSASGSILTQGFQQPEDWPVSITEIPAAAGDIMIYPNPTSGMFTLNYTSSSSGANVIKLYNLVGQVVYTQSVEQSAGSNTVSFDIGTLSQGIYMLELMLVNDKGETEANYRKINLEY